MQRAVNIHVLGRNHNFVITNYKQDSATFLIYPLKRILRYRRVLCMPVKPEWSGRRRVRSLSTCSRLSAWSAQAPI